MPQAIRWGILSTGHIAQKFAVGLSFVPGAELVAVGSRSQASAEAFGDRFMVPHRHASYTALAQDPDVDVVYVATPHHLHKENGLLCLEAGKAVLCEKPFTINALEAGALIGLAREKDLFLMEAMWTRFLPGSAHVQQLLRDRAIGEARLLMADFGFRTVYNPQGRWLNPELGGGALLDVGVYLVTLASMIFGTPSRVTGLAHVGETGVDEQAAAILGYPEGQLAVLSMAVRTSTPQEALILGTEGCIRLHAPWWKPTRLTLTLAGREAETSDIPFSGNGYNYEAAEVMKCMRAGRVESELMPLDETLSNMKVMDQLRARWGLVYPMEQPHRPSQGS